MGCRRVPWLKIFRWKLSGRSINRLEKSTCGPCSAIPWLLRSNCRRLAPVFRKTFPPNRLSPAEAHNTIWRGSGLPMTPEGIVGDSGGPWLRRWDSARAATMHALADEHLDRLQRDGHQHAAYVVWNRRRGPRRILRHRRQRRPRLTNDIQLDGLPIMGGGFNEAAILPNIGGPSGSPRDQQRFHRGVRPRPERHCLNDKVRHESVSWRS